MIRYSTGECLSFVKEIDQQTYYRFLMDSSTCTGEATAIWTSSLTTLWWHQYAVYRSNWWTLALPSVSVNWVPLLMQSGILNTQASVSFATHSFLYVHSFLANISSSNWFMHNDICKNKCAGHAVHYQPSSGSDILICDEVIWMINIVVNFLSFCVLFSILFLLSFYMIIIVIRL